MQLNWLVLLMKQHICNLLIWTCFMRWLFLHIQSNQRTLELSFALYLPFHHFRGVNMGSLVFVYFLQFLGLFGYCTPLIKKWLNRPQIPIQRSSTSNLKQRGLISENPVLMALRLNFLLALQIAQLCQRPVK